MRIRFDFGSLTLDAELLGDGHAIAIGFGDWRTRAMT
jgi:hypothetical protein